MRSSSRAAAIFSFSHFLSSFLCKTNEKLIESKIAPVLKCKVATFVSEKNGGKPRSTEFPGSPSPRERMFAPANCNFVVEAAPRLRKEERCTREEDQSHK